MPDLNFTRKDAAPSILAGFFFLLQMIYGFFYADNTTIILIEYFGVGVFILSGIFGMLPVIVFQRKGGVEKGKSYIHTTTIVDTGIYSVIRHPQYSAFILWAIGAMLLFQNWIVIILGFPVILLTYFDMTREDKRLIQKFGKSYEDYMKKVPRANFLLGIFRVILK